MTSLLTASTPAASTLDAIQRVDLRCFTYGDRDDVLDGLLHALDESGCWVESRRAISPSQIEMFFVAMLGASDELYGGLAGAGVEMVRDSHRAMTLLCTLRRHRREAVVAVRTVSIRMELSFLAECDEEVGMVSAGLA
jgi:hypothetical protein